MFDCSLVVEYPLRRLKKPIGVAQWRTRIVKALPKKFKGILPTVEGIEAELGTTDAEEEKDA